MSQRHRRLITTAMFAGVLCASGLASGAEDTITNPVAPNGNDPWIVQKDGFYYYCYSGKGGICVNKDAKIEKAVQFNGTTVWTPEPNMPYSKEIWAPELHFLRGRWYIYFAADNGQNKNHRMYVLKSKTQDAMGSYSLAGRIGDPSNKWAIDGTVLNRKGKLYFIWSGWEGDKNGQQNLYIAAMSSPTAISSQRVLISRPEYNWEKIGRPLINEGPEVLVNKGIVFVIYSASGSWTDNYCLGQLRLIGRDPLKPQSWKKCETPVFSGTDRVISPGHASFTKSPDGRQDWIVYHAARHRGAKWNRNTRMQPFTWDRQGNPCCERPVDEGVAIPSPAEE